MSKDAIECFLTALAHASKQNYSMHHTCRCVISYACAHVCPYIILCMLFFLNTVLKACVLACIFCHFLNLKSMYECVRIILKQGSESL